MSMPDKFAKPKRVELMLFAPNGQLITEPGLTITSCDLVAYKGGRKLTFSTAGASFTCDLGAGFTFISKETR